MKILVLNSGSSSIKFQIFKIEENRSLCGGVIEQIGEKTGHINFTYKKTKISQQTTIDNHLEGIKILEKLLIDNEVIDSFKELGAVGHRVVHGGEFFNKPVIINNEVLEKIKKISSLAPLHNPVNIMGIEAIKSLEPNIKQVAVFDTAFHQSMPKYAYCYALPYKFYEKNHVRRYGFHGTSHQYVSKMASKIIKKDISQCNFITLHLGNGASACAIKDGKSVDTSMGLTPLEGLVMGTRSGDIDPAIIFYLSRELKLTIDELDNILNKQSGLKGICGTNDLREVEEGAARGDKLSELALEIFCYRVKKYIGSYTAILERVDAIIFTGGIGEHSRKVREKICSGLEKTFGIKIDDMQNEENSSIISQNDSSIKIMVIPTNEELEIAQQTYKTIS